MQRSVFHGKLQITSAPDKLTPNPRSGSGGFDFINHTPRTRRQALSQQTLASIAQSGSCGFHAALATSTEAPYFGLPTANSLRSMVDSRAKRPRRGRRGRSRQRYRGACTRRPRQRRQVTPALNPTYRQKPARLRALAMSPGQLVALLVAWLAPGISRARKSPSKIKMPSIACAG